MHSLLLAFVAAVTSQPDLPIVEVRADNTVIDRSCRVVVPDGLVIADADGNGVIHIRASGITVEFADGAALRGAATGVPWDEHAGVGIRIDGQTNVTLRNARTHGFKVGVWATEADGLTVEGADASDGYAMRLRSTPQAEDGGDWLWPHENDKHEWMDRYGAGLYVERSSGVTVRDCVARRRQNGIILDRVTDSRVYDNDCSFLSGWGLAMWRSSDNVISRNAFDFCVRGYSHGVYNRGQDSAGILVFEQCSRNVFAENSATHGGDGFFGFAGKEALGENPGPEGFSVERAGCNDNLLINNDFSYAPAHGIEMTFSFGNRFIGNRLVENAICGVWGGYSQDTLIAVNHVEGNGEMAYGLERGGINIEHGANNLIRENVFRNNKCGVHLWWDDDQHLFKTPWAKANHKGCAENAVIKNRFEGDDLALHLRDCRGTKVGANLMEGVKREVEATPGSEPEEVLVTMDIFSPPEYPVFGRRTPVGARAHFTGRHNIVMGEFFPWDHRSPFARRGVGEASAVYEVFGGSDALSVVLNADKVMFTWEEPKDGGPNRFLLGAPAGVHPYAITFRDGAWVERFEGTIVGALWTIRVFPWTIDPREDLEGWRAEANGSEAMEAASNALQLKFAHGGPRTVGLSDEITASGPGPDRFGVIASTRLQLSAGRWRVSTLSDDGVRVTVDGSVVLENWTWHGPTRDRAEFIIDQERIVEIVVEHFEIDGYAVLTFDIEPAPAP